MLDWMVNLIQYKIEYNCWFNANFAIYYRRLVSRRFFFYWYMKTRVTKAGKLVPNPDNYDITDMRSDDSTDDDSRPKKTIPTWARSQSFFSFFFFFILFFSIIHSNLNITESKPDT